MIAMLYSLIVMGHALGVPLILDTDLATDVDDVGALAVAHALADNGEAEILGIMHNTGYRYGPAVIRAINAYYGRPTIPVGQTKSQFADDEANPYVKALAEKMAPDHLNDRVPDAVTEYRKILSHQPSQSVTIVSIGFLTNLRALLESNGDSISPLGGRALVKSKVANLFVMGGGYPTRTKPEFNFSHLGIGPTTRALVENWPTDMVFSGFEIGVEILTGHGLAETPSSNPVREAYRLFHKGKIKDRWSWDQATVLAAVRGPESFWKVQRRGRNVVRADGQNEWRDDEAIGHHAYLIRDKSPADVARTIDLLMRQSPKRGE